MAAVAFVYAGVLNHDFLSYDDDIYVVDNPSLRQPLDWSAALHAFREPYETNWIPLTWLSLHLDYALHGLDAGAFLATNAALHAAASVLLFLALARLTGTPGPSAFAAGLFAVHPLHVESVAWVAERKDVLAGLFFSLALLAYARSARAPRSLHLGASTALAAGLCAKQSLVPVPLLLVALDFWPLCRIGAGAAPRVSLARALCEKGILFALSGVAAALAVWAQRAGGAMAHGDLLPLDVRLANATLSIFAYLRDAIFPTGLAAFYPHPQQSVSRAAASFAALGLLVLTALCFRLRARAPWWLVGWLWFLLLLGPTLGLVQVGVQARADRYTYLALTGLALALATSAVRWAGAVPWRRRAIVAAASITLAALAVTARRQVEVWRNSETVFAHAAAVTRGNFLAEHALGSELLRRGDAAAAEAHFAEAVRIRPEWPEAHFGLADALAAEGRFEEAVRSYEQGSRLAPNQARGHLRMARALLATGRSDEALGRARYAVRVARPSERAAAEVVLGAVLLERKSFAAADAAYARALALRPDLAEAHAGRGFSLLAQGRADEAAGELARAEELGGDSAALRLAQGDAARSRGRLDEARRHYVVAAERAQAAGDAETAADASQRLSELR